MFSDRFKIILLVILAFVTVIGAVTGSPESDPVIRYILVALALSIAALVAAWIGISGMMFFKSSSSVGRSLLFISLGVASWGLGNLAWFVYNMLGTELPYPSLADVGYLMMIPLASYGLFRLLKNIEIKLNAKNLLKLAIPPLAVFALIFPIFIYGKLGEDTSVLLKILNITYPVGDVIFLSFALVILSISYGSVLFRSFWVLSIGFVLEAVADFTFSYTTAAGTYYSGCWVDVLFSAAFCVIGIGMYHMYKTHRDFIAKTQVSVQKKKR